MAKGIGIFEDSKQQSGASESEEKSIRYGGRKKKDRIRQIGKNMKLNRVVDRKT